jgi:hypothetical protein
MAGYGFVSGRPADVANSLKPQVRSAYGTSRSRSSTIVITKDDGGVIGT